MTTITVLDSTGATVSVARVADTGAAAAANSLPVVLATDQPALPLSTGAATAAAQTTGNASLSSIDGKVPALAAGRMPVQSTPTAGTLTDRSGTITAGGTAQQLMSANASRLGFAVQNVSSGDLWINALGTAAASQPSILLVPGAYFETPQGFGAVGAVSILGATTSQPFSAREW